MLTGYDLNQGEAGYVPRSTWDKKISGSAYRCQRHSKSPTIIALQWIQMFESPTSPFPYPAVVGLNPDHPQIFALAVNNCAHSLRYILFTAATVARSAHLISPNRR
jgi:hypothetical protein